MFFCQGRFGLVIPLVKILFIQVGNLRNSFRTEKRSSGRFLSMSMFNFVIGFLFAEDMLHDSKPISHVYGVKYVVGTSIFRPNSVHFWTELSIFVG